MMDSIDSEMTGPGIITRREAVRRVTALLGGVALVGGTSLLTACEQLRRPLTDEALGEFSADDVALLDEIAETILPATSTPGAKAAGTGAFMALMVTDTYKVAEQRIFRDGMRAVDEASRREFDTSFLSATPAQRTSLLERLDREQNAQRLQRERATAATRAADTTAAAEPEAFLPDQRQEKAEGQEVGQAAAVTEDTPTHYFRMMKELALLGYFTSEIGCTQAQRYVESPGRFDPCVPYQQGERAWAPHA